MMWSFDRATPSMMRATVDFIRIQIRTATKRAAGSRTSMKDSAGRRLGAKKVDGEIAKPGEILMRQRGTKYYPGENVSIGKDHTLFALEPGYVRYYLDPFHPKRKFIGVALTEELKLPTPHFAPRVRRFGRMEILDKKAAEAEEKSLPRKLFLARPLIEAKQKEREERRAQLKKNFAIFINEQINNKNLNISFEVINDNRDKIIELICTYLLRVRMGLKNGFSKEDSQFNSKYFLQKELELHNLELENQDVFFNDIIPLVDLKLGFTNKLELTMNVSQQEIQIWKNDIKEQFGDGPVTTSEMKQKVLEKLKDASKYLTLSEEVRLRRKLLKPVLPETFISCTKETHNESADSILKDVGSNKSKRLNKKDKIKSTIVSKRFDTKKGSLERVVIPPENLLSNL